jgi:predicted metal-dependent phosphoesterase TrpH
LLKFQRNKLVSIERRDEDTLFVHGVLDDDIYGLELDVSISISELEIRAINGKWNRWTTPECPRSTTFLQEALGFRIREADFSQKVHKIIGRKSCRHYANLLLECCHSAREAATVARWEDERVKHPHLSFERYLQDDLESLSQDPLDGPAARATPHPRKEAGPAREGGPGASGGIVIDMHVHTNPASPCSIVPVDELISEAKRIGLDGICLTDHNHVWDPEALEDLRQRHGFLVLGGNEITTNQGDMLVFGLDRDLRGIIKLEELREMVLSAEGFIIVAHPFRGFLTFGVGELGLTHEKAMKRPLFKYVDAVEVLNGKVTTKENSFASKVAEGLGLPATGGSDAHEVVEVGLYATRFSVNIKDDKGLLEALKTGNYSALAFRNEKEQ